jgi:hypothetical protein
MEAEAAEAAKAKAAAAAKATALEAAKALMTAKAKSDVARGTQAADAQTPPRRGDWEFLWRFIAVAMLFEIGWVIWIAIQINPPPIALPAAFAAAAKARANRNFEGQIVIPDRAPAAEIPITADPSSALPAPREPLVNVERLRLAESIETAVPERSAESTK